MKNYYSPMEDGYLLFENIIYYYKTYGEYPKYDRIEVITYWDKERINQALKYLIGKGIITASKRVDGHYASIKVTPDTWDLLKDKKKFKKKFGIELTLGLNPSLKFSLNASEK